MLGLLIRLAIFSCVVAVCLCRLTNVNNPNQFDRLTSSDKCLLMLDNPKAIESRGLKTRFTQASQNRQLATVPFLYANCNQPNIQTKCLEIVGDIESDLPAFFPCLNGGLSQDEYIFSINADDILKFFDEN